MSRDNKFLIISIFLGTTFLAVSATAMETGGKKENDFNISKSCETSETSKIKETKENMTEFSDIMDKKEEMRESDSEIRGYEENEKETEENLKKFGYGNTKQEQQKTKEWIESWGFDNECIYKKMRSKQFSNVYECVKTLIEEQEKYLNYFVEEFKEYIFKYTTIESKIDYYDNFCGKYDNYGNFEVDKEELEKVLNLAKKKNLNKNIIIKYIKEVLIWDKQTRNKIKDYGQLIENVLKYIRKCKFKEHCYFEEKDRKHNNDCDLNVIDILEKEYIKLFNNNVIKKTEEISSEDYSVFLKDNEFVKLARIWIDMWGGNLKDLYKNKLVNIEEIKEYVMKVVNEDIDNFYEVLKRFETYECEFKDCDLNNKNDFFDVVKLEEIIEKENENLKKDYGIKINAKIVSDYVYNELLKNENERKEITNYKDLIEKAYENFISNSNGEKRNVMCDSNLNPYKFYDEGYNIETAYDEKKNLTYYKSWKQGKFDIYKDDAICKIKKEYEEIEFILKMREILEKINEQDEYDLKTDCANILKKYRKKIAVKIEDMETLKDEDGYIECKELQNLKDLIDKKINIRWGYVNYENRVDYSKGFFFVLNQAIYEGLSKQFINEIINLTKEEYYPDRFIEKFKKFIVNKFHMINTLKIVNNYINRIIDRIIYSNSYQELGSYKIPWGDLYKNYPLVEKLDIGLEQDFKRLSIHKSTNFSNYFYISIFKMISSKYKLRFFEKLKDVMEELNNFEEIEKISNLVLFLEDLKHKKLKNRDDIKKLIDIIKNDIDRKSLKKLEDIFKINSDKKEKINVNFLEKILELSNNMIKMTLDELEGYEIFNRLENLKIYYCGYFKNLENLIESYNYHYEEEVEDVKKIVDEFVNEKFGGYKIIFPKTTYITETGANRILKQFKKIIKEEEIINKFEYELKKIPFLYTKDLLLVISNLLDISINIEDFKNSFSSLIKVIYDIKCYDIKNNKNELQIFLHRCLDKGLSEALNQYKTEKNMDYKK